MTSDLPMREIVATGLGVISPVGQGQGHNVGSAYWQALLQGASGVRALRAWDASRQPVQFGGELLDFEPKQLIRPRKSLKVMSREIQTAVAAASLAIDDAGFGEPGNEIDPLRMGIVLGAEMLYAELGELADLFHHCVSDGDFRVQLFGEQFPLRVYPLWLLKYLPNMSACHVSIAHNAQGPCNTLVSGDVSSLLAVLEAARVIQRGAADFMLTGGSGSRLIMTPLVFRGDRQLSRRNDDPTAACRPFDLARDGMVNGEGSAVMVLEHREHAVRRGARILATFLGGAATHATRPDRESKRAAVRQSIQRCLSNAGVSPDQVCHVNAHGLST
ncbi:MAG: beta-ketoacyl synthase N-terminal-like domain-containing protein, partial [Planctomycetota bacterium]|nr:beta-ketoacyl synthase N-terminal-like domain-containing protein [Planctomycetota bacterium]